MSPEVAAHFATREQQQRANQLGMWLFLCSELLLFGGLFCAYAIYRTSFPETWREGGEHLSVTYGTVNTVVLITSSLTVVLAVHFARHGSSRLCAAMLGLTLALAGVFLCIKAVEYAEHFHEGALPGRYFAMPSFQKPGASLFFTLYYFMTGLHAVHVLAGMGVLGWMMLRALRGEFSAAHHAPVELGGMYWHLVDVVWIFLFPLLYLI